MFSLFWTKFEICLDHNIPLNVTSGVYDKIQFTRLIFLNIKKLILIFSFDIKKTFLFFIFLNVDISYHLKLLPFVNISAVLVSSLFCLCIELEHYKYYNNNILLELDLAPTISARNGDEFSRNRFHVACYNFFLKMIWPRNLLFIYFLVTTSFSAASFEFDLVMCRF